MTDKSKLKTRSPSSQFLAETKPPEFVPRTRAKKNRAWYRPEDTNNDSDAPIAAAADVIDFVPPQQQDELSNQLASCSPLPSETVTDPSIQDGVPRQDHKTLVPPSDPQLAHEPAEELTSAILPSNQTSEEAATIKPQRQGAEATPLGMTQTPNEKQKPNGPLFSNSPFPPRAQALIDRAKNGCPHEYLFRQILMFEI